MAKQECIRCGRCCRLNPPALHLEDVSLIKEGHIPFSSMITFRKGEILWDNVKNRLTTLEEEIIRIRSKKNNSPCYFFEEKTSSCIIYVHRPMECRKFKCWDPTEMTNYYDSNRMSRLDIISSNSAMGQLIEEYEKKIPLLRIKKLVPLLKKGEKKAAEELKELLLYDRAIRDYLREKLHLTQEIEFFLGRSVEKILYQFDIIISPPK